MHFSSKVSIGSCRAGQGIVIPHQHPYGMGKYGNGQGMYWAAIAAIFKIAEKYTYTRSSNSAPLAEMLSTAIQFSHTGFINKKDSFGYGDFDSKLGFSVQEIPQV